MKKIAQGLILMAFSSPLLAAPTWGDFSSVKVSSIISHIGGNVEVLFFKGNVVWKPCGVVEWYVFDVAKAGGGAMKSSFLTALAADKSVSIIYDCDNNSIGGVKIKK
ncbi:hypothetical protein HWV03_09035 [Moritella sp. 36]|uniref:hypothetical protein n=1 Tax=Moritella sp. 36 TaxID=2746233 RepID=UPI001BAA7193|nr:hypothetical protein [Moritella sp. 36]QUM88930.1 hypothetical protein HWV03_09035 [Moritella sp. 36]